MSCTLEQLLYRTEEKSNFTKHLWINTGDQLSSCTNCFYRTVYKSSILNYIKTLAGDKPLSCIHCPYKTEYKSRDSHRSQIIQLWLVTLLFHHFTLSERKPNYAVLKLYNLLLDYLKQSSREIHKCKLQDWLPQNTIHEYINSKNTLDVNY